MDPQDYFVISMALSLEAVLERKRRKKRAMEESLRARQAAFQQKVRERTVLMRQKQDMVAEEAANEKLVANFMVFIDAIENDNPEIAQNFDEKEMTNNILSAMKSDGGENFQKIIQDLEEKTKVDAVLATINSDASCAGDKGGTSNAPKNTMNRMGGTREENNDGGEDEDADGCGDSC
ncbi:hypothetical protein PTKIN_Ptkin06aG0166300 [Pterospermum kingtungense]